MPIEPATLAAFCLLAAAIVVAPGPDTMLILRCGLAGGQRAALAAVAGVQMGLIVHTALAIAGISWLIAASPTLFRAVTVAGAAYLGWLGMQGLRGDGLVAVAGGRPAVTAARACRDAVLTNILNPKVILLFVALYPNFVAVERGRVALQLAMLSVLLIAINVLWQAPLAWFSARIRTWLARPRVLRLASRLTGAILLFFAGAMLYEHIW